MVGASKGSANDTVIITWRVTDLEPIQACF